MNTASPPRLQRQPSQRSRSTRVVTSRVPHRVADHLFAAAAAKGSTPGALIRDLVLREFAADLD